MDEIELEVQLLEKKIAEVIQDEFVRETRVSIHAPLLKLLC